MSKVRYRYLATKTVNTQNCGTDPYSVDLLDPEPCFNNVSFACQLKLPEMLLSHSEPGNSEQDPYYMNMNLQPSSYPARLKH
jgi:hypothetical protein